MAAENSSDFVLFSRGQDDNDIWDDTALIKAYDHAVSAIKSKIEDPNKEDGGDVVETDNDKQSTPTNRKKKNSKRRRKAKDKKKQWKPEDVCRAVYSVDGQLYDAHIVSVDEASASCVVSYFGYGNEEEKYLSDLLSPGTSAPRKKSLMSDVDTDSMEWNGGSPMGNRNKRSQRNQQNHRMPWGGPRYPEFSHNGMPPPPPPPPPMPPMPQFSRYSNHSHPRIPAVPPPPPMLLDDSNDEDNDALCSMLMSWYMSGYHTGYYQGLRQGKLQWNGPDR